MKVLHNHSLKNLNTFRVDVSAKYFADVASEDDLLELLKKYKADKKFVLGQGANILLTKDFDGLVLKNSILGITQVSETKRDVVFEVGAGENWHQFVMYSVNLGLGGIENLVYIPGTVGAAPVQNIAAYGQNFEDVFVSLDAIAVERGKRITFGKADCKFEYRSSRFKHTDNGKYIVTKVRIKLSKNPEINTSYFETGKTYAKNVSLATELAGIGTPSIKDVAEAVMRIRKNKLPDIAEIGTAGSVFKNPIIARAKYEELKKLDPDLQCYPVEGLKYEKQVTGSKVKVPAARLLDNLGWKGLREGQVGTHPTQALAVVNYGGATGEEILAFMQKMKNAVKEGYGIELEEEVLII